MNLQKYKLTIIVLGVIFLIFGVFGFLFWNMNKAPVAEVNTSSPNNIDQKSLTEPEEKATSQALVLEWRIGPSDLNNFPEEQKQEGLEKVSLKISGIVNDEIELVDLTSCSGIENETILPDNIPAYEEMSKNKLGSLSCWFAGKGEEFSINKESETELVIRQITIDSEDNIPLNELYSRVVKKITLPENTIIEIIK